MNWRSVVLDHQLGDWAARWDALCIERFHAHPMLRAAFIDGLLQHWPAPGLRLCVLEGDAGVEAMCLLRPVRTGVWASYLPSQTQIAPALMRSPLDLQALLRCLPWPALQLDLLSVDPRVHGEAFHGPTVHAQAAALTMSVRLDQSDDAYWASRSKKLRDNLRRHQRLVESENLEARFVEHEEPTAVDAAVTRYAELESAGWKGRNGTALVPGNSQHAFYAQQMRLAAGAGQAQVFELWFGQRLVASRLVVVGEVMVVALKTAYDEAFKAQAPGRLLLRQVLARAQTLWPGRRFEFYTNASPDQLAWATGQRQMLNLTVYRNRLLDRLAVERRMRSRVSLQAGDSVQMLRLSEPWPEDVSALFENAERQRIAYGERWLRNLASTVFSGQDEARIYVLRRDDAAVAALPVLLHRGKVSRVEALSNYYTALYAPVVSRADTGTALIPLVRAVLADCPGCSELRFGPMDPVNPSYAQLRSALRLAGLVPFDYFCHGNWYQLLRGTAADYLAAREGALRNTIKRAERKLANAGAQIEILSSSDETERAIQAFVSVYGRSWKRPEPYPDFMPGLMRLCAEAGWLRVGLVWLNGEPIAAQLWIVANARAEIYKLAYDEAHKSLAPGTVLTARLMQHVIDVDRVNEVDYLIGDDPYKAQWTSERRERWGLVAYNRRSARGLLSWLRKKAAQRVHGRAEPPMDSQPSPD